MLWITTTLSHTFPISSLLLTTLSENEQFFFVSALLKTLYAMGNRFDKTTTVTCPANQLKTLYAISCPGGHFSYSYTFQTRNFFYFQVLLQPNDVMHCLLSGVVVATPFGKCHLFDYQPKLLKQLIALIR